MVLLTACHGEQLAVRISPYALTMGPHGGTSGQEASPAVASPRDQVRNQRSLLTCEVMDNSLAAGLSVAFAVSTIGPLSEVSAGIDGSTEIFVRTKGSA